MKKLIFTIIILISLSAAVFSQEASEADTSENPWKEIGQQGMKALKETGKFFKDAGIETMNEYSPAAARFTPQS